MEDNQKNTVKILISFTLVLLALILSIGIAQAETQTTSSWGGFIEPTQGQVFEPGEIPAQVQRHPDADTYKWEIKGNLGWEKRGSEGKYTYEINKPGEYILKVTAEEFICVDEPHISPKELNGKNDFCRKELVPIESDEVTIKVEGTFEDAYFQVIEVNSEDTVLGKDAVTEAKIKNVGNKTGTRDIEFKVYELPFYPGSDPIFEDIKEDVEINPGETKTITFSERVPTNDEYIGEYESIVTVREDSESGKDRFEIKQGFGICFKLEIISGSGGNVTQPGEGKFCYEEDKEVDLVAEADPGYKFRAWLGDTENIRDPKSPETTIKMQGPYTILAAFEEEDVKEYELNIDSSEGGSVTEPGEGTFTYNEGEEVGLIAESHQEYKFKEWIGDIEDIEDPTSPKTTITMNDNYDIEAIFEKEPVDEYTLTINSTKGGNVTIPGEGTFTYNEGEEISLLAEEDTCNRFINWTGDTSTIGDVESPNTTIEMLGNYSITANFEEKNHSYFEVNITSPQEDEEFTVGDEVTVEYEITNKGNIEGTQNITFAVEKNGNVEEKEEVTLQPNETYQGNFTWTAEEEGTHEIIVKSNDHEDTVNVIVTEEDDDDDGTGGGGGGQAPGPTQYRLTINVEGQGTTSLGERAYTYNEGREVEVTAMPEENWYFTEWTGRHPSTEETIKFNMTEDKEITANFEINTYPLNVNVDGNGTVEINPDQLEYEHGTEVELTANPDEGHEFTEWTGDYESTEETITIEMTSEKTINAQFAEKQPYFEIDVIEYDEEVTEGEELNITIEITNTGGAPGTQTIVISKEDPEEVLDSQEITLDEGETQEITLTWETELNDSGEHTILINSENQQKEINVNVLTEEEPTTIAGLVIGAFANPAVGAVVLIAIIILSLGYYKREDIKQRLSENLDLEKDIEQ